MNTTDHVLLIILTSLLSIFFIVCIIAAVAAVKLIKEVRIVVSRAEDVVNSVETATEVLRHTGDKVAIFKIIKTIVGLTQKKRRK